MKTKTLIFIVILLEIGFLSWTTSVNRAYQDSRGESIFAEQDREISEDKIEATSVEGIIDDTDVIEEEISTRIKLMIKVKGSNAIWEKTCALDSDYLYLRGQGLTAILLKKLKNRDRYKQTIKTLNQLTKIDVSNNYLREFPYYFLKLESLEYLNLSENNIRYINSYWNSNSYSIEGLDLSINKLKSYSTKTLKLPYLQYLNLSSNYDLSEIYMRKEDVQHLKELDIRHTAIANDSQKIAELYKLLPNDAEIIY